MGTEGLPIIWDRVMDVAWDAGFGQVLLEIIPIRCFDDVEMRHVFLAMHRWRCNSCMANTLRISSRNFATTSIPFIQQRQHYSKHRSLHFVQPAVAPSCQCGTIFGRPAILPQLPDPLFQVDTVCDYRA